MTNCICCSSLLRATPLQLGPPHGRVDKEDEAGGDGETARHQEVVEGGVVPGVHQALRALLVGRYPRVLRPMKLIADENEDESL